MNIKQRVVLMVGALLFVALRLYPPWQSDGSTIEGVSILKTLNSGVERGNGDYPSPVAAAAFHLSHGYALIFLPPDPTHTIDMSRLAVEWLSLVTLTGSLIVVLHKPSASA